MPEQEYKTLSGYDRQRAGLADIALWTKPTTVQNVIFTGQAETFVVRTARDEVGDHIFIERMDESGVVRLAMPPKVANAISRQRDSLTARMRSRAAKKLAADRKAAGIVPGFMRKK